MPAKTKSPITASNSIVTRGCRQGTSRYSYSAFAGSGILDARGTRLLEVRDGTTIFVASGGGGGGGGGGVGSGGDGGDDGGRGGRGGDDSGGSQWSHGAGDEGSTWKKRTGKEERKKERKPWSPVAARTAGVEHAARRYNAAADPSDKKWRSS